MKDKRKFLLGVGSAVALLTSSAVTTADQNSTQKIQSIGKDQQTIVREVIDLLMLNNPSEEDSGQISAHSSHSSHGSHGSHSSHSSSSY